MPEPQTTAKQKPEKTFRLGKLNCSVFAREHEGRTYRSVTLQRSYKDGDEWKFSTSLNPTDLANAATLLQHASKYVLPLEISESD